MRLKLLFASFIEKSYVDYIEEKFQPLEIIYRPDLINKPRYRGDHIGSPICRSTTAQKEWLKYVEEADIIFDFDKTLDPNLNLIAKNVQWIQATSSGIGGYLKKNEYLVKMPNTQFTTAKGVHSVPLAEFCMMSILMWSRNYFQVQQLKAEKVWERFSVDDLSNKTVGILGVGKIGKEIANHCKFFKMKVFGIKNNLSNPSSYTNIDKFFDKTDLKEMAKLVDFLILVAPQTTKTNEIVNSEIFNVMKPNSYLINIGRGSLVNERHLIEALKNNTISGAALDVFVNEPLPRESEFWNLSNVILFPHSASTTFDENKRITELFCHNIELFLNKKPLVNQFKLQNAY